MADHPVEIEIPAKAHLGDVAKRHQPRWPIAEDRMEASVQEALLGRKRPNFYAAESEQLAVRPEVL